MTISITRVYTRTGDKGTTALVGVPADIRAEEISLVGRYGIQFRWSDGHSTGIYPFDTLRAACACETCRRAGI